MPSRKREADALRALCAHVHPDDGVNPRDDKKHAGDRQRQQNRKLLQLCRQTANVLQLLWPSVDRLGESRVVDVVPAPNAGRLRAIVAVTEAADPRRIAERFEQCNGYLRREVASATNRRRTPELVFAIAGEERTDV